MNTYAVTSTQESILDSIKNRDGDALAKQIREIVTPLIFWYNITIKISLIAAYDRNHMDNWVYIYI